MLCAVRSSRRDSPRPSIWDDSHCGRVEVPFVIPIVLLALMIWNEAHLPAQVTASVIAYDLHRTPDCTRVILRDNGSLEGMCWGAHVSFAYAWEKAELRNCTITNMLHQIHAKGEAQSILRESYALGSMRAMFIQANDKCSLDAPPSSDLFVMRWILMAANATLILWIGSLIIFILWEWYRGDVVAWFHRHGLLLAYGSEGGGEGANKKTDEPLIASAPLP